MKVTIDIPDEDLALFRKTKGGKAVTGADWIPYETAKRSLVAAVMKTITTGDEP